MVSYTPGYSTGVQITTVKRFIVQALVLYSLKKCQISEAKISILIGSFNEEKISVKFYFNCADFAIFEILLLSLEGKILVGMDLGTAREPLLKGKAQYS
jgi:hypothetical protein